MEEAKEAAMLLIFPGTSQGKGRHLRCSSRPDGGSSIPSSGPSQTERGATLCSYHGDAAGAGGAAGPGGVLHHP